MTESSEQALMSHDPRVQTAWKEYLEAVDCGEAVEVESFLAQRPEAAGQLRSLIAFDQEARRMAKRDAVDAAVSPQSPSVISSKSVLGPAQQTTSGKNPSPVASPAPAKVAATSTGELTGTFGRYKVHKKLGSGAMGAVYLAEDSVLQRRVALKIPTFDDDTDGEMKRRFYREAKAVAGLKHPNLYTIYDVGEIDGRHFISMEFVAGRKLTDFIKPGKPMTEKQAMAVVRKIALGMHEAHSIGVLHRDLKPDNIMVNEKGEPVVMDFGLVHKVDAQDSTKITQHGTLIGSPAYMSKEQVEGDPDKLTGATDQYSLGVILYQLLTSKLPFEGGIHAVLGAILVKEPPPPSQHRTNLNKQLEVVCLKMMAKEASDRYPTMKAAADALAGVARGTSTTAGASVLVRPAGGSPGEAALETTLDHAPAPSPGDEFDVNSPNDPPSAHKSPRRRRPAAPRGVLIGGLAAGLVLLLAAIIWVQFGDTRVKIEILAEGYEVKFNEAAITITDGLRETKVQPGDHTLHIKSSKPGDDGVVDEFDTEQLTLKKGGKPVLIVTRENSEVVAKLDGKPLKISHSGGRKLIELEKKLFPSLVYVKVAGDDRMPIGVVTDSGVCTVMPGTFQDVELLTLDGKRKFVGRVASREPYPFCWIDSTELNLSPVARATEGASQKSQEAFLVMHRDSAAKICTGKIDANAFSTPIEIAPQNGGGLTSKGFAAPGPIFAADGTCLGMVVRSDSNMPIAIFPLKRAAKETGSGSSAGPSTDAINEAKRPGSVASPPLTTEKATGLIASSRQITPGKWQPLVDDKTPLPDPEIWSYKDGVLKGGNGKKLNHFQTSYIKLESIDAGDVIMRSRITVTQPVVSGCGFDFRNNDKGGYYAWCHNWFGMGRSLKGQPNKNFTDIKTKQFHPKEVDWAIAAVGDQLSIHANGERIYETTSKDHTRGTLSLNVKHTGGTFNHPEVMVLDGVLNVTKEWVDQAIQKRMNEWVSGTATVAAAPVSTPPSQLLLPTSKPGTRTRTLPAGYCMDVAVTPDGTQCVSIDLEGTVSHWEMNTGKYLGTLGKHGGRADELLLIVDGRIACSGSWADGTTAFFDLKGRGESLGKITGQPGLVRLAVTADGQRLLLNSGTSVRTYCITLTSPKTPLSKQQQQMISGKKLAFQAETSEGTFQLHEEDRITSYTSLACHPVNADWIYHATIDGSTAFRLWDRDRQKEVAQFEGLDAWPQTIRVSGDGRRITAKSNKAKHLIWDAATGAVVSQFNGPAFAPVIDISHDGSRVMLHGSEAHLEEWSVDPPKKLWELRTQRPRTHHVHYFDKGRQVILAGAYGAEIWKLDVPDDAAKRQSQFTNPNPTSDKLAQWAKSRYQIPVTRSLAGHTKLPLKLVFSRDGSRLLSASEDGTLRFWNTATAESLVTLNEHKGAVTCCALSADGKQALSGGLDDTVRWWDLDAGTQLAEFKGHGAAIYAVAFDAGSNEAVSVSANNTICRWNLSEKKEASRFTASQIRGYPGRPDLLNLLGASFTPDARQALIPGYFGTIHLIDTKSQSEAGKFGAWGFRDMTFTADGTLMACTSEHSLSVWDVATKTQKVELQGKNGGQRGVAFTQDGKRLIVGANNQPTRVWDIESKAVIGELSNKANGWSALATSPDGKWAASGGDNGKVLLWPLSWITE